ncbi:MAG: YggS family pyridoxal phosphate-dependent enzyme [Chloroflexota bacterium]|nr:YggS family pyridoxal phosphate-dependent enzyme [Chloroflexota bacterium]
MQPDGVHVAAIAAARERVLRQIGAAAARSGRDPSAVTLVAVSKTVPAERLVAAVAAGLTTLGENRVQEAESKAGLVAGATWHLVGPLQSNKAKRALGAFSVIESVDSVELAERLDRLAGEARPDTRVPVLLQVNVDSDPAKAGFAPETLADALARLATLERLAIRGLMTVGRLVERAEDARPTFIALRVLSERLRSDAAVATILGPELSMGMSDDFAVAVEEGATIVRVGRALFGSRV